MAVAGSLRFRSLSASEDHTCGVTVEGAVYCWGSDEEGKLGVPASGRCSLGVDEESGVEDFRSRRLRPARVSDPVLS